MAFGFASTNFNVQAGLSTLMSRTGVDQTLSVGLGAASGFGGASVGVSAGVSLNAFASSFGGVNVNPFASMGMGTFGATGGIGAFAAPPSPQSYLAAQFRYSGHQFAAGNSMTGFRGGSAAMGFEMNPALSSTPSWMTAYSSMQVARNFGSNEVQGMLADRTQSMFQGLAQLQAKGAPQSVLREFALMSQMQMVQEATETVSKISSWGHNMAKGIIANIKA